MAEKKKTESAKKPAAKSSAAAKKTATPRTSASKPAARSSTTKSSSARTAAPRPASSTRPVSSTRPAAKSADELYGESNSIPFQADDRKDTSKNKKIVLIVIAGLLLLLLLLWGGSKVLFGGSKKGSSAERSNTLALAQKYLDKGQYDKAMDLLNSLLISNPNDEEADKLLDQAIQLKNESDQAAASQNSALQQGDQSYNINIDTDEITNALREQNERSQQMINDLLEQQRQSQNEQREQAAAEKKAAEEMRKQEEAERKAKEEALAKKNAALKSKIGEINEKILAGKADLNTGNIDSALSNFNKAVSQLPLSEGEPAFSASKYSEVASALYEAGENEKDPVKKDKLNQAAINYVNKALSVNPNDPVSHYILGMNYIDSGDWNKASKELEAAVKNDPDNYLYYYQLGRVQYKMKNYSAARASFESSIKYNRNFDSAYFNLGMTCKRMKQNKDALAAFRNAHTVNPQNSKSYLEEARILKDSYNDAQGAISCYNQVISIAPDNSAALNECGVVYSSIGQYAKAESYHRKAVALLKPGETDPITYYNLATALFNQKKNSDAEKYSKLAYGQKDSLKSAKDRAVIVYNHALIEESIGNTDKAIVLYKEVLTLDPDNAKTKTNLGVILMSFNPPETDMALTYFLDAYKNEKSFELENNLGSAYLAKKDYSNAVTHFQNALKKSPKDNTVRFNLAQAYAGGGEFDNAKTCYLSILNDDPKNYDAYIELAKVFIALKDTASADSYLKILQQKSPTYRKAEVDALLAATSVSQTER